jgi:hypothetical protein
MQTVQDHIVSCESRISDHPFFERLRRDEPLSQVLPFASMITFWVMGFQDALRLNVEHMSDPWLKEVAEHHWHEDSGHDAWFLKDLLLIEGSLPAVRDLFSKRCRVTRDVTYALIAESFRAQEDIERITLILIWESAARASFPSVLEYLERMGVGEKFQYFGPKHLDAESEHEVFEQDMQDALAAIKLSDHTRDRCIAMVSRCYDALVKLLDSIEQTLAEEPEDTTSHYALREAAIRSKAAALR